MVYADKTSYEGFWENDLRNGEGLLLSAEGEEIYRGNFQSDNFHGKGRLTNNKPTLLKKDFNYLDFNQVGNYWIRYEGEFFEGKKHGHGTLLLSNGEKYEGEFSNDLINGKGTFLKSNGTILRSNWKEGKLTKKAN